MTTSRAPREIVRVRGLEKRYPLPRAPFARPRHAHALRGVDLALAEGESVVLAGESGAGKSTLARALLLLVRPEAGELRWTLRDGRAIDLAQASSRDVALARREAGIVFQDPFASLPPRRTVRAIVGEALLVHGLARGSELEARVEALVRAVGLPADALARMPHAFSGGERQRIALARALSTSPRLLILDEAFSALDATRALELVELVERLRDEHRFALLLVAHDLVLARRLARRALVLYAGRVVEEGPSDEVLVVPRHPYAQALVAAAPDWSDASREPRVSRPLGGEPPSPVDPPPGCAFHPRCPLALETCRRDVPELGPERVACPVVRR